MINVKNNRADHLARLLEPYAGAPVAVSECERGGLVEGGELTDAGRLVVSALYDARRLVKGAAGAALLATGSAELCSYLEERVKEGVPWRLRADGVGLLRGAGASGFEAAGCAALACAAAADCELQSWRRGPRVALAFEAVGLGAAAWAARGVRTGFEAAALRIAACYCHGQAFSRCRDEGCPRSRRNPGVPVFGVFGVPAAAPTSALVRLLEERPERVARAAARLALGSVGDAQERHAFLLELQDAADPLGAWNSATDYFIGARSPRILRAPAVGWASLASAAAILAREAALGGVATDAARAHAWRAVFLLEACYRACGVSGDARADVVDVVGCDCSGRGVVDCERRTCRAFQPLAEAVAVTAVPLGDPS